MRLLDKAALITGGARGLGLAMAERFVAEGACVIIVDRDRVHGEQAATDLSIRGFSAHFIQADLAYPDEIERAVDAALSIRGHLDILVNNAAVILPKSIEEISASEWDWLMSINLRAPFLMVKAALPALKASHGVILNIGSIAGLQASPNNVAYGVSKAGVIMMTKNLARDLHSFGIRVNCLCPGAVDTPLLRAFAAAFDGGDAMLERTRSNDFLTTPQQIADVALYLVSDEASAITGSIIIADAGMILF
ncbi:MAG: SDR family oxidoreductase [Anaerolineae bacterium]|nr:SDR family oxidoreductase [Anaerolineae bacterium]MDW8099213.1 SDR family oxidoreductase [Anaerolineae bacterium]